MAKSGNRGVVWLIVLMIIAALAYRFWPRGSSTTDKPIADAAVAPATPDAAIARVDAARGTSDPTPRDPDPPRPDTSFQPGVWSIHAISTKGDKVLLYRSSSGGETPAYRVVVIEFDGPVSRWRGQGRRHGLSGRTRYWTLRSPMVCTPRAFL